MRSNTEERAVDSGEEVKDTHLIEEDSEGKEVVDSEMIMI